MQCFEFSNFAFCVHNFAIYTAMSYTYNVNGFCFLTLLSIPTLKKGGTHKNKIWNEGRLSLFAFWGEAISYLFMFLRQFIIVKPARQAKKQTSFKNRVASVCISSISYFS
jgi:hypothetical protein